MNLNNLKSDLHGVILQIGEEIYDERITKSQIDIINVGKIKLSNARRYENNERIQYKLNLLKKRYDCEIEYLKYRYTEMYYKEKKRIKKLFDDGLLIMVMFIIQKLDYELQSECKSFQDELRHDMERDFKILLNCVLEQKTKELTLAIKKQVEAAFQKDLQLVNKMWLYFMRNIEVHLNASVCEQTMKSIHILCAESATANLKRWQLRKANQMKIAKIKKHIKFIKGWKPQLQVCPNIEIGRKNFTKILKKMQKYFNFYFTSHGHLFFDEIDENLRKNVIQSNISEHKLETTRSIIFGAFDSKAAQHCCTDESKVFVTTKTDVVPITDLCADQTARLKKEELERLKKFPPPDKFQVNWTLCDSPEEESSTTDFTVQHDEPIKQKKESEETPNLVTDLLLLIDPEKLALQILQQLNINWGFWVMQHQNVSLQSKISELLKEEIEHKLNNEHVLNILNAVLGPAFEAVRMKRISALSYLKDSITVIKNRPVERVSVAIVEPMKQNIELVEKTYPISLKMTHKEYMDSFQKLPPYLFPQRPRPSFDSIYKKIPDTDLIESILSDENLDQYLADGPYLVLQEYNMKKDGDHVKHQRTSILKTNPREKLLPFYTKTLQSIIKSLGEKSL